MCQKCPLLSLWEAEYIWEDHNFLENMWELETILHKRGSLTCAHATGRSKAVQKQDHAREVVEKGAWLNKEAETVGKGHEA